MADTIPSPSENDISKKAEETWDATKEAIADSICDGKALISSNPLWAVLGALALGVILGSLVPHRHKATVLKRYIEEPLDDLQSLARTLCERAARQAGRGSDVTVGAMESILSRIKNSLKF